MHTGRPPIVLRSTSLSFTLAEQNDALASTCISLGYGLVGLFILFLCVDNTCVGRKRLLFAGQASMTAAMCEWSLSLDQPI
jgi:hypothetical protein